MVSEKTSSSRTEREIFAKALSALVAAQSDWNILDTVRGAERQAIESWAAKAKVDLKAANAKARSKLLSVANNALLGVALGSTQKPSDDRLGDLGLIAPRRYDVSLGEPFKSGLAEHGLTNQEVIETVHGPDAYQHLSPPNDFNMKSPLISLFVRVLNRTKVFQEAASAEWCLTIARRAGLKILVTDGYRVFQNELKAKEDSPLSLFQAFCAIYGCELKLGDRGIGKFLNYERLEGEGGIAAVADKDHKVQLSTMARHDGRHVELAFGYAIDLTTYAKNLERRKAGSK